MRRAFFLKRWMDKGGIVPVNRPTHRGHDEWGGPKNRSKMMLLLSRVASRLRGVSGAQLAHALIATNVILHGCACIIGDSGAIARKCVGSEAAYSPSEQSHVVFEKEVVSNVDVISGDAGIEASNRITRHQATVRKVYPILCCIG